MISSSRKSLLHSTMTRWLPLVCQAVWSVSSANLEMSMPKIYCGCLVDQVVDAISSKHRAHPSLLHDITTSVEEMTMFLNDNDDPVLSSAHGELSQGWIDIGIKKQRADDHITTEDHDTERNERANGSTLLYESSLHLKAQRPTEEGRYDAPNQRVQRICQIESSVSTAESLKFSSICHHFEMESHRACIKLEILWCINDRDETHYLLPMKTTDVRNVTQGQIDGEHIDLIGNVCLRG